MVFQTYSKTQKLQCSTNEKTENVGKLAIFMFISDFGCVPAANKNLSYKSKLLSHLTYKTCSS